MEKPTITLKCSDGEIFNVGIDIAQTSLTIKNMLQDLTGDNQAQEAVPLYSISGKIFRMVLQWAEYHRDYTAQTHATNCNDLATQRSAELSSWDSDFLRVDQSTLVDLIAAADFLDIRHLLDICCRQVANMIRDKTPEEIRRCFGIKRDLTAAEEDAIRNDAV